MNTRRVYRTFNLVKLIAYITVHCFLDLISRIVIFSMLPLLNNKTDIIYTHADSIKITQDTLMSEN